MAIVKHRPTFEILPSEADGYLIVVTWPKGPEPQNRRRDPDHDCGRSQASQRPHRAHRRAPYLGIGAYPPSARPYHRPRRRLVAQACPGGSRGPALDCLPTQLFSVGAGALTPVPPPVPGKADRRLPSRAPAVLRRPGRAMALSNSGSHSGWKAVLPSKVVGKYSNPPGRTREQRPGNVVGISIKSRNACPISRSQARRPCSLICCPARRSCSCRWRFSSI